jgi:hypothetical protein
MNKARNDVTVQARRASMVRGDPLEDPTLEDEAQTETIQTLQDHQRDLPCGISAETPCGLGNT